MTAAHALPPHDLGAEVATLGALLSSHSAELTDQILAVVRPGDFYDVRHQTVAAAVVSLRGMQLPTDPVTVGHHLGSALPRLGGLPLLYDLVRGTITVASGPHYAGIVRRHAVTRARQAAASRIQLLLESDDGMEAEKLHSQLVELTQQVLAVDQPDTPTHVETELDWGVLLGSDFTALPFLTKPLLSPGAQISLVGDGKVGKSLFCFEWALRLANGHPFLQSLAGPPIRVGYVDQENGHDELQRRLYTTGYDDPALLGTLHYQSFPRFGPLDTQVGASALVAWVQARGLQVLYLDTISRMIQGPENDADTWLALYRLALLPLKALGVAVVRLDHFGKDQQRGSRGSSAKTQDIDHEWVMTATPAGVIQLKRTYTRNGIGDGLLLLRRLGNPTEQGTTTHEMYQAPRLADGQPAPLPAVDPTVWDGQPLPADPKVADLVQWMDRMRVPEAAGRRTVGEQFERARGTKPNNNKLQEAINWRRQRQIPGQEDLADDHEEWVDDAR